MFSQLLSQVCPTAIRIAAPLAACALGMPVRVDPQCSAQPPPAPPISAATITAAKDLVKQWTSATPTQAAKIDSIPVVQEKAAKPMGGETSLARTTSGWLSGPKVILYWDATLNAAGLTPADAGSDATIAVLAVILWHEMFHFTDGETGGLGGAGAGGVPGGSDCKHIGLQWSSAMRACDEAGAAAPASASRTALCKLFKKLRGAVPRGIARQCKLDGHPDPSPPGMGGPPSWGFPNGPWNSLCEACP